ncbi:Toll-like receptor 6 [Oryzias melastigma]|uniref:Toll-like receptor 6 n=1 Tax=Oryzias melastigma TaxID=30732 RepID=A0A834BNZ7_ORYME|nr:Toll-like receptor 6 [Oryzias melastigma]
MLLGGQICASLPGTTVDLSSRNLSSVPKDLPRTAVSVDLSKNHIHQVHKGNFKGVPMLGFLNVSWNGLEHIDAETFRDTPDLEYLDLSHNRLANLSGQQYLVNVGNLMELNLAWNTFLNMTLGEEFSFLLKLKGLTLGAKNIGVGDFRNIAGLKLQSLTLFMEDELGYEVGSLINVNAKRLTIVFTDRTVNCDLISDALLVFDEVEIRNLTQGFDLLTTQLKKKPEFRTSHLAVNDMAIEWKKLTEFLNVALQTSIVHISSTDTTINEPPYFDTKVVQTARTKSLKIRRGVVSTFFFSQVAMYNFFINLPVQFMAILETSIIHMTCPKKQSPVVELDFSSCALSDSLFSRNRGQETIECETLSNLTKLSLVDNNLKNIQLLSKRVQHMISLQHLDLSLNSLVYDGSLCLWPPSLTVMNLSSGGLTERVFECLPLGLEQLDLQNNQISVVPTSVFKLTNLSTLNLNSNRLRDLPGCDIFPLLNELLLKSNSLHAPSVNKLASCPNLKTLDVSHNPFTCTCALRDFIRVAISTENARSPVELLNWPVDYYCTYPEELRDSHLKDFWLPEVSCNAGLLAATILVPAGVLIISVVFLCHHLDIPWYMSMIWQWVRAKHRARTRQVRPEDLLGVEFHAFVSYSQHDVDWVKNVLLPNLEGSTGGLRICHHEKNFVPGKTIVENIMACVEKSRRSVFVLSAHFVKSEWCHYELYFASHQGLSLGTDGIVLVLLEPLPQYLIPNKYYQLKAMMRRHTYLEWPQDRAKHRLFWANLRAALQADLPNLPVTDLED